MPNWILYWFWFKVVPCMIRFQSSNMSVCLTGAIDLIWIFLILEILEFAPLLLNIKLFKKYCPFSKNLHLRTRASHHFLEIEKPLTISIFDILCEYILNIDIESISLSSWIVYYFNKYVCSADVLMFDTRFYYNARDMFEVGLIDIDSNPLLLRSYLYIEILLLIIVVNKPPAYR